MIMVKIYRKSHNYRIGKFRLYRLSVSLYVRGMGIEHRIESPLAQAVRKMGSQSAFARLISMSQTTVYEWLRDQRPLPAEHVLGVEAATGISRHDLRPDIYPIESPGVRPDDAPEGVSRASSGGPAVADAA
jgi:DNA-binding transcriptional regulator YdaS (Cro superfamily)